MNDRFVLRIGCWLLVPALVGLYVLVRCLHLDLFITTDEPFWLGRSANFYRALNQGDLVHTYQMAHPGILTMWAGTFAYLLTFPEYAQHVTANLNHVYGIDAVLRELGQDPMGILNVARVAKILLQGLMFGIALGFLHYLFGRWVMVLSGLLITFDPFVSGLDSLLHVDGLFAITSFAAVLAMAAAARSRLDAMTPWLVAGALAACAWMTRATGLVLVAMLLGAALVQVLLRIRTRGRGSLRIELEAPVFSIMLWTTGAMAVSLLLLPALWVDPFGTMQHIWDWSSDAASGGHERPIFFLGEAQRGDPGVWFYPVTLLWRSTPVSLIGVVAFLALLPVACRRGWITRDQMRTLALLIVFAGAYTLAMSLGAKKFDRYILPVYPVISVLAAVGGMFLARRLRSWKPQWRRVFVPTIATLLVLGQVASLASAVPYRIDYFNPVFGGLARAQHYVQVGWGEGAAEAVAFIADDAEGREVTVQTSSVKSMFTYVSPPNLHFASFGLDTPAGWFETDYFVPGIQEWQRDLSPSYTMMQDYEPVHKMEIQGVPFFEVYTPRMLPPPERLRAVTGCTAIFGEGIRLMQIIGRDGSIDMYWLTTGEVPDRLQVSMTLSGPGESSGSLPTQTAEWDLPEEGLMSRVTLPDPRGPDAAPLPEYEMSIQIRSLETGDVLVINADGPDEMNDELITHSECYYAT